MIVPLYYVIQINYPNVTIGFNQQVQLINHGDGNGDQIDVWNVPNTAQPTSGQLLAWQTDPNVINAYQAMLNTWANQSILDQLEEIDKKSIRAVRENDTTRISQWNSQANTLRANLLPMTAAGVAAANTGSQ